MQSFMLKDGIYSLNNITTHYWFGKSNNLIAEGEPGIFKNPLIWKSIYNTLKLAFTASIAATITGTILGYIVSRGRGKISGKIVEQLSFIPFLIPSIAFSAIYLSMFSKPRLFIPTLYGTFTLLVLVSVVKYLPFAVRSGTSNMLQIGYELEEAAMVEGASWVKRFTSIVLPLAKKGFLSGFLLVFISAMKELDLLMLLVTPDTRTLTALTFSYTDTGYHQFADAIMTVIAAIIITVYFISLKVGDADITKGIGG
jgi:iron(III) transport system permease protein